MSRDSEVCSFEPTSSAFGRELGTSASHWCSSHRASSCCSDYSSLYSRRRSDSLAEEQETFKVTLTEEAFAKREVKPLKSSRSQSLLSQLLDDESSCLQSMTSSFRCSQVVRIFDLYQHMPHADLDTLLVRDLIIAVASLYEIQMDETLALYVADEMGFREEGFPALTQNACVGVVGEDSFVLMQGEQRIAHVQIKPRKSVTVRKPGESWKYDGDHYISPIREKDFSYHRRELNCSVPSEGWYSYHSHQQLADKHLSKSQKQTYSLDGEERRDSGFLRRWQHRQSEDAITEPCTEDENEDDADDADAGSNGPASDEEIFDFDDA